MGCGVSRFETPLRKIKTTKINPRLHHRIEEVKRRRHTRCLKKVTPSKKELLRHQSNEDVGEFTTHFNPLFEIMENSTHTLEDNERCIISEDSKKPSEKVEKSTVKVDERLTQNVPYEGTFEGVVKDEKVENVKCQNADEEAEDEEGGMESDSNDDERRIGKNEGGFQGSPSFRIYYIENVDAEKNGSDNESQELEESTYQVQNSDQRELAVPLKDSATMTEKKCQKRRGFAKAIKGRKIRCA